MAGAADVLVVGGGPAGATAARTLALEGRCVRLLDRARFPRNKPCGGAISMRALRRFPHLPGALQRISTRRLSRLYLEAPSGDGITLTSHEPAALMVRRIEFDGDEKVVDLLYQGQTTDEIAEARGLSNETVRSHIRNLMRKLGAKTRAEAVALAHRARGGDPPVR